MNKQEERAIWAYWKKKPYVTVGYNVYVIIHDRNPDFGREYRPNLWDNSRLDSDGAGILYILNSVEDHRQAVSRWEKLYGCAQMSLF